MPQFYLVLLLSTQIAIDTSAVERLYYQQHALLERLAETVSLVGEIAHAYESQGLASTPEYSLLREQQQVLDQVLESTREELGKLASIRANPDTLHQLEAIQTRLLVALGRSNEDRASTDIRQRRAHQQGKVLQEIDKLIRRQADLVANTNPLQETTEVQQKLAADTTTAMLELSQRSPNVAKQLQRALQSMRLASRKSQARAPKEAAAHQQTAMDQLRQARQELQQSLEGTGEQNSGNQAAAQLPLVSELARTQRTLEQRIGAWDHQTLPSERLRALHQQRALSRQLGQLQPQNTGSRQELEDASELMQQTVEALTNGHPTRAQDLMRQSVQALQAIEMQLIQQVGLPDEAADIAQMARSVASGSELANAVQFLEQLGIQTEEMPSGNNAEPSGDHAMAERRWAIYEALMDALYAQLDQERPDPKHLAPDSGELLIPSQTPTDEQDWQVDLGILKRKLDQAMKLPSAEQYADLLRKYFTEIAEQPR